MRQRWRTLGCVLAWASCAATASAAPPEPPAEWQLPEAIDLNDVPKLAFWEWSGLPLQPERRLVRHVVLLLRRSLNFKPEPGSLFALGQAALSLQAYAATHGEAPLRDAQALTIRGFLGLLRDAPHDRRVPRALLGLIATYAAQGHLPHADRFYQRLTTDWPTSTSELGLAHLVMAEMAVDAGDRALAQSRYARALALLPLDSKPHFYAFLRQFRNERAALAAR